MKKSNNMKLKILIAFLLINGILAAQNANNIIKEGNEKYKQQDYAGAQQSYEEATLKDPSSGAGNYNLGNAYYQQQQYDKAIEQFKKAGEIATSPETRADAYHNMGNAYLQQKKYQESVDAYKHALRESPADADTKYNLAYAQQMLKKQQQQQQQNQDQKNQDQKKQEEQKNKEQQNKNQQQKDPQQQTQPKQYSKEELERILESLNNDDKSVQDKVNKQKAQKTSGTNEKDW